MKVASLDFGSNTFLCLIAETDGKSFQKIYRDESRVVRLSEGVAITGYISDSALQRAETAIIEFRKIIDEENKKNKIDKILGVTTAVARQSSNSEAFYDLLKKYNLPIQLLSGSEEADITFQGAISGMTNKNNLLVIDIGGGSTEVIFGNNNIKLHAHSFDFGVVRLKDKFNVNNPISPELIVKLKDYISTQTKVFMEFINSKHIIENIVAVAGTPTSLAAIELGGYDPAKVDGYVFNLEKLETWFTTLSQLSPEQITKTYGVESGRADVLAIGVLILIEILKLANAEKLKVSIRGVRYGVALWIA